jgi:spheroidene monooxygenase
MQTTMLSLFRFDRTSDRLWVLGQMGLARFQMPRAKGLQFWKLCGTGTGEGFTPRPNWGVWAILTVWDSPAAAQAASRMAPFSHWAARASESYTLRLAPLSARGQWAGQSPFSPSATAASQAASQSPIAALTRASVKLGHALQFWGRVPDISAKIGQDPAVLFKIGIGEVPLLHQVTFSVWPDATSMAAFARRGAHAEAIRAVRDNGWFAEELYARFQVLGTEGRWHGQDPIARHLVQEAA